MLDLAARQAASNRAADAGTDAARALSKQAWSTAWMPRVDSNASASQSRQKINSTKVNTPTTSVSLSASLPVWRAADRASARAQEALASQAGWQARVNRASVARELSVAYIQAVAAAERRRLTQAQLALLQEQLRINDRRLQAGVGTVLDVLETRTRLDQARAALQDLNTRITSQRLLIERLTGEAVVLPSGLDPNTPDVPEIVPAAAQALSLAQDRNPSLQEAAALVTAAEATTSARTAERWQPTLDAVAAASHVREVPKLDGFSQSQNSSTQTLGLQMNWPLFTGGYQQGRDNEAAALLVQAQARLDDARSQADTGLRDAYQILYQARASIAVQRDVEYTASATFDALRKAFQAGMRTNIDLLNAQEQIYAARQNLVNARLNAVTAQIDILALLDQLDGPAVAALTPLFDNVPFQERAP